MEIIIKPQEIIKKLVYKVYFFIFHKPPGDFTKRLLKNLFFALFGVSGATLITFGFNALAIRYLGAEEYGKLNLIISVSNFLIILPLFGLNIASLRYLAAERENKNTIINTALAIVIVFSLMLAPIYLISGSAIKSWLKIPDFLYVLAVFYAILLVFHQLFHSFFQGLEEFKKLSFLKIISASVFVITVSYYLFWQKNYSFSALFWGNIFQIIFFLIIAFLILRPSFLKFQITTAKKLLNFGGYSVLGGFIGFFSMANLDILMINHYIDVAAVGLYSAYYAGFSIFTGKILATIYEVFLPMASASGEIQTLFSRFLTFIKKTGVFIFAGNFLLVWFIFKLYGSQFIFDYRLGLLIALSATIWTFNPILASLIQSLGVRGMRFGTFVAAISATLNVGFNFLLIPRFGLFGAVITTIITSIWAMSFASWWLVKFTKQNEFTQ